MKRMVQLTITLIIAVLAQVTFAISVPVHTVAKTTGVIPNPLKISIPVSAKVSWQELLELERERRNEVSEPHRVAPIMPIPEQELISLGSHPTPADVLATQVIGITTTAPPIVTSFLALGDNNTRIPPDTHGAAGPNHVMTMLNSQVRVQTRDGVHVSIVSLTTFWSSVGGSDVFDPRLIYDAGSGRWLATCEADSRSDSSSVLFAISSTADPTGAWAFYRIDADPTDVNWSDFPDIGYNVTWIAITSNMYTVASDDWSGNAMWVIDKSTALAGGTLTITYFPVGSDNFGGYGGGTLRVCKTFGSEPKLYLVDRRWKVGGTHVLRLTEITGTAASPVWSATPGSSIPGYPGTGWFYVINGFDWNLIDAAQLGTAVRVETNDARMLNAVYRNGRVWCTHHAGLPEGSPNRTAVFWYEINPAAMPTPIVQSGVIDGGYDVHHFYPSIAVNANNDVL
ncbi:MAG: hypothetical protein ACE5K8_08550, partial [Candidatus Zixiibacteriota bacterium]